MTPITRMLASSATPAPQSANAQTESRRNARCVKYSAIMNMLRKGRSLVLKKEWAYMRGCSRNSGIANSAMSRPLNSRCASSPAKNPPARKNRCVIRWRVR